MAKDKLDEFHRLVADGRYREARGILESESDIPEKVAEKWRLWLDELHHEEWVQAGVISDQKKQDPQGALGELGRMIGGMLVVIPAVVVLWLFVESVMTYQTASTSGGAVFLLMALVGGTFGWQRAALFVSATRQSFIVGAMVTLVLVIYLVTSGFPLWYYYEPPLSYRLAAFALLAPGVAYFSYNLGGWVGQRVMNLLPHETL